MTFTDEKTGELLEPEQLHPEVWREMIMKLVSTIWIEDDGSITLEGHAGDVTHVVDAAERNHATSAKRTGSP